MSRCVLVTDFDGTITARDFYRLVVERLLRPEDLGPWEEYRAGSITHFTALQRIFRKIDVPESALLQIVDSMEPDPDLHRAVSRLQDRGWRVVVASAGCRWYIDIILGRAGVDLEVHANPGEYCEGALCMEAPVDSPFYSPADGVDKLGIVRFFQNRAEHVAFAGDGLTDVPAALAVPPSLRFARADLAASLEEASEPYRPFSRWNDVAQALLDEEGTC